MATTLLTVKDLAREMNITDVELLARAKQHGTVLSIFSRLTPADAVRIRGIIRGERSEGTLGGPAPTITRRTVEDVPQDMEPEEDDLHDYRQDTSDRMTELYTERDYDDAGENTYYQTLLRDQSKFAFEMHAAKYKKEAILRILKREGARLGKSESEMLEEVAGAEKMYRDGVLRKDKNEFRSEYDDERTDHELNENSVGEDLMTHYETVSNEFRNRVDIAAATGSNGFVMPGDVIDLQDPDNLKAEEALNLEKHLSEHRPSHR